MSVAVTQTADLMQSKLKAKYSTKTLADGLKHWRADHSTYKPSTAKAFYKSALTSMSVAFDATMHVGDLAHLYWKNVTL